MFCNGSHVKSIICLLCNTMENMVQGLCQKLYVLKWKAIHLTIRVNLSVLAKNISMISAKYIWMGSAPRKCKRSLPNSSSNKSISFQLTLFFQVTWVINCDHRNLGFQGKLSLWSFAIPYHNDNQKLDIFFGCIQNIITCSEGNIMVAEMGFIRSG